MLFLAHKSHNPRDRTSDKRDASGQQLATSAMCPLGGARVLSPPRRSAHHIHIFFKQGKRFTIFIDYEMSFNKDPRSGKKRVYSRGITLQKWRAPASAQSRASSSILAVTMITVTAVFLNHIDTSVPCERVWVTPASMCQRHHIFTWLFLLSLFCQLVYKCQRRIESCMNPLFIFGSFCIFLSVILSSVVVSEVRSWWAPPFDWSGMADHAYDSM